MDDKLRILYKHLDDIYISDTTCKKVLAAMKEYKIMEEQ